MFGAARVGDHGPARRRVRAGRRGCLPPVRGMGSARSKGRPSGQISISPNASFGASRHKAIAQTVAAFVADQVNFKKDMEVGFQATLVGRVTMSTTD